MATMSKQKRSTYLNDMKKELDRFPKGPREEQEYKARWLGHMAGAIASSYPLFGSRVLDRLMLRLRELDDVGHIVSLAMIAMEGYDHFWKMNLQMVRAVGLLRDGEMEMMPYALYNTGLVSINVVMNQYGTSRWNTAERWCPKGYKLFGSEVLPREADDSADEYTMRLYFAEESTNA